MKNMATDPDSLRIIMRNFSKHSRLCPSLAKDIVSIDGLNSESNDFWLAWKDAVLDLASDASDHNHLLIIIKRSLAAFAYKEQGHRAACILTDLAKIVPSSLEIIMKHLETAFPYWKSPQAGPLLQSFTQNSLKLGSEVPQIMERIVDFLTKKLIQLDSSIRPEDVPYIYFDSLEQSSTVTSTVAITTTSNESALSGIGEKFCQEERAKEQQDILTARRLHLDQVRDFACKIDLMLLALLEFIHESSENDEKLRDFGLYILISFEKNILTPSLKSKYTQFLVFFAASKNAFVADRFLGSLVAFLFSKDAQLSSHHSSKPLNNTPAKAKSIRIASCFLSSFIKNAPFLNYAQVKSTCELLLDWIGRKVEALAHYSKSTTEIYIISSVLCCLLEIVTVYPDLISYISSSSLNDSIKISYPSIPLHIRQNKVLEPLYSEIGLFENTNQPQVSQFHPFNPLELPLCKQFILEHSQ